VAEVLDWLNTKAALSMAVIVLIGTAGAWYGSQVESMSQQRLEVELERFVTVVNYVCMSASYISVKVTQQKNADGYYLSPDINGDQYEITLTRTHARFTQDDHQCSMRFVSNIYLMNDNADVQPGSRLSEKALTELAILKVHSGSNFSIIKVNMESNIPKLPVVVIVT